MNFDAKLLAALHLLDSAGIPTTNYAPPIYQFLWKRGVKLRPPHFAPFWFNAIFSGSLFGLFWGGIMWAEMWLPLRIPFNLAVSIGAVAGSLFGLTLAIYYSYSSRKHKLPRWRDFQPDCKSIQD